MDKFWENQEIILKLILQFKAELTGTGLTSTR